MAIQEISVFPQFTISEAQGLVGTRQWTLDVGDGINAFIEQVCQSHWPERPDLIPVGVESGPFLKDSIVHQTGPRKSLTLGALPTYGKYTVIAHYALHKMTNCWPFNIAKPTHPPGTTLTCKVRGSGQYILVAAAGMMGQNILIEGTCDPGGNNGNQIIPGKALKYPLRVIVPVTEYHITCDRMTKAQVDEAMIIDWDTLEGCVNSADFLGALPGTLLFDGYEIDESFACDFSVPNRYRMSAAFKQRVILDSYGNPKTTGTGTCIQAVGWNHDFIATQTEGGEAAKPYAWRIVLMRDGEGEPRLRYQPADFSDMFGDFPAQNCNATGSDGSTMGSLWACGNADPALASEYDGPGYQPSIGTPDPGDQDFLGNG